MTKMDSGEWLVDSRFVFDTLKEAKEWIRLADELYGPVQIVEVGKKLKLYKRASLQRLQELDKRKNEKS